MIGVLVRGRISARIGIKGSSTHLQMAAYLHKNSSISRMVSDLTRTPVKF